VSVEEQISSLREQLRGAEAKEAQATAVLDQAQARLVELKLKLQEFGVSSIEEAEEKIKQIDAAVEARLSEIQEKL
jgi:F0F1-type ATP synthase membrane subunit b/b'